MSEAAKDALSNARRRLNSVGEKIHDGARLNLCCISIAGEATERNSAETRLVSIAINFVNNSSAGFRLTDKYWFPGKTFCRFADMQIL